MITKKSKLIALVIGLLTLFTPLVACNENPKKPEIDENRYYYDDSCRERASDSIPQGYDLENETIVFWYHEYEKDTIGDAETTDIVYSRIHERNRSVEERLNVDIDYWKCMASYWPDSYEELRREIQSMSTGFDAVFAASNRIIMPKLYNYYHNLNDSNYITITEPWWYVDAIMELSVDNYNYRFLYGDIQLNNIGRAGTIYYNKNLYEQYLSTNKNGDELYEKVLNGTWTIDELSRLIKKSHISRGGDGTNDIYGAVLTHIESAHYLREASGIRLYERDASGMPVFNFNNDDSITYLNKLYDLYFNNEGVINTHCEGVNVPQIFTNGSVMFEMDILYNTFYTSMREMKDDFGIIPYPKANEEQDEYITLIHDAAVSTAIPVSTDIERANEQISAVIEALASESYRSVMIPVYENALKSAYNRDELSAQMIDIICAQHDTVKSSLVKNFVYEYTTSLNNIGKIFANMMLSKTNNFASTYDTIIGPAQSGLRDLLQNYIKGTM